MVHLTLQQDPGYKYLPLNCQQTYHFLFQFVVLLIHQYYSPLKDYKEKKKKLLLIAGVMFDEDILKKLNIIG